MSPVRLDFSILAPNPGLGNVARCSTSDLRWLAHEERFAHAAGRYRHDGEAVWPRWRASRDRGESLAQAAIDCRQERRVPRAVKALSARPGRKSTLVVVVHWTHHRQP